VLGGGGAAFRFLAMIVVVPQRRRSDRPDRADAAPVGAGCRPGECGEACSLL